MKKKSASLFAVVLVMLFCSLSQALTPPRKSISPRPGTGSTSSPGESSCAAKKYLGGYNYGAIGFINTLAAPPYNNPTAQWCSRAGVAEAGLGQLYMISISVSSLPCESRVVQDTANFALGCVNYLKSVYGL